MKHIKNSASYKVLAIILAFCFSSCFNLFEKEQKTLAKIDLDAHSRIEANFITTGATTNDVVQIVFVKGDSPNVIGTFESYNWVELIKLSNDSLLVKLSDSTNVPSYIDTQYIKIPSE